MFIRIDGYPPYVSSDMEVGVDGVGRVRLERRLLSLIGIEWVELVWWLNDWWSKKD